MKYIFLIIFLILFYIFFQTKILQYNFLICQKCLSGKTIFKLDFPGIYNIYNPSITISNNKYILCCRMSTNTFKNLAYYIYGRINYKNFYLFIVFTNDKNYQIIFPTQPNINNYSLEDPRIIEYKNNYVLFVSENRQERHNNYFPLGVVYDKNFNFIKYIKISKKDYFKDSRITRQKNWCPFIHKNELYLHTDAYPIWKVFKLNYETGKLTKEVEQDIRLKFKIVNMYLRCSTSWKSYDSEYYICGLHTRSNNFLATIQSLLVLISKKTLLPEYKTDIFCLEPHSHDRIQFLSGLEIDDTHVILGYGVNDCEVKIKKIPRWKLKFYSC
jgi:hypothetical protein